MHVHGYDRLRAANLMVAVVVAYTVGAFLHGAASDRWLHRRKPLLVTGGLAFLSLWLVLVLWPGEPPPEIVSVAVFILASVAASANVLSFAVVKESNAPEAAGLAMAIANAGILCAGVLQPLMGAILDLGWQGAMAEGAPVYPAAAYQRAFISFALAGTGALVGALLVQETNCRDISREL